MPRCVAGYDPREAQALLKAALARTAPGGEERVEACRDLLQQLVVVVQDLGIHVESRPFVRGAPPSVVIGLPRRGLVRVREEKGTLVARKESSPQHVGPGVEIPLDFDPVTSQLVSRARDESTTPAPGELWPLRSPLAVVAEAVIALLESLPAAYDDRSLGASGVARAGALPKAATSLRPGVLAFFATDKR